MLHQLGLQTTLKRGLDQRRHETAHTSGLQLVRVDLREQRIQAPRWPSSHQWPAPRTAATTLVQSHTSWKWSYIPFKETRHSLHRQSDTLGNDFSHRRRRHPDPAQVRALVREPMPGPVGEPSGPHGDRASSRRAPHPGRVCGSHGTPTSPRRSPRLAGRAIRRCQPWRGFAYAYRPRP